MSDDVNEISIQLEKIIQPLPAMHLAQLTAFAFGLPPLYFCREYQPLAQESIIEHCQQRLLNLLNTQDITLQQLSHLLAEKEFFDAEEASLRVGPELVE
ncbi:hypothetical protein [uncultured Psychromonas sp.]|uniref:hypothetical protein n=1 Tax=uncultured Psychromonas sp. TaxID=173974 RepID=UPI0026090257|nr:hypothetical protein [uncultured Psychromonas sp.]